MYVYMHIYSNMKTGSSRASICKIIEYIGLAPPQGLSTLLKQALAPLQMGYHEVGNGIRVAKR